MDVSTGTETVELPEEIRALAGQFVSGLPLRCFRNALSNPQPFVVDETGYEARVLSAVAADQYIFGDNTTKYRVTLVIRFESQKFILTIEEFSAKGGGTITGVERAS